MAQCRQCSTEIPRGQTYHGERFKSLSFCCEACYEAYIKQKDEEELERQKAKAEEERDKKFYRKLTDYIDELWKGEEVNWPFFTMQIKNWRETYGVSYKDILIAIKYGIEYENHAVETQYGLAQFVRYLKPSKEFAEAIQANKEAAENMPDEEIVYVKPRKQRAWIKEEDWD